MKKIFFITLILLIVSCGSDKHNEIGVENINLNVVVNGTIEDYKESDSIPEISIYINDFLTTDNGYEEKFPIDSLGNFSMSFLIPRQQDVYIYRKSGFQLILSPGDSLNILFNEDLAERKEVIKSMKIEGNSAAINKNFAKYSYGSTFNMKKYYQKLKELSPNEYKKYHDSIFSVHNEYIDSFIAENKISENLKTWLLVEKEIAPLNKLLSYKLNYQMFGLGNANDLILEESFFEDLNKLSKMENSKMINTNLTSSFINYYYFHFVDKTVNSYIKTTSVDKISEEYKKVTTENVSDSLILKAIMKESDKNKLLAQLLMNEGLNSKFRRNNITYLEKEKNSLDRLFKGSVFEDYHKEQHLYIKSLLDNPEISENIKLLTFKTEDSSKFLDEIIKNAKGKIIYIDNWATWCGPCKSQFKNHTPQFKKRYSTDVEFVYLCYQSDKKLWKPTISQYKIEGKHYFISKEQEKILFKKFKLTGFPTYTIINKDGDIVKSGFEYRPSEKETSKIINQLIGK